MKSNHSLTQMLAILATTALIDGAIAAGPHEHHHHRFPADVDAFHAVLAPVWHAERGVRRTRDACAKSGEMAVLARNIRSTDASRLQASLDVLSKVCEVGGGEVDRALFDVHEEFHRLIEPPRGAS